MKKHHIKLVAVFLSALLILSILPHSTVHAVEANGVQVAMNQILNVYPSGSFFTLSRKACTHGSDAVECPVKNCRRKGDYSCANCSLISISNANGVKIPSGQGCAHTCLGFASYVINQVFGIALPGNTKQVGSEKKPANEAASYQNAKVGDLIYFYKNDKLKSYYHVAVCMGITNDAITLYECNASSKPSEVLCRTIPYEKMQTYHKSAAYCAVYRAKNYDKVNGTTTTNSTPILPVVTPQTYTVILNDDGSIFQQITVTNGGTYDGLLTPSKDGYTFDGWYTQKTGGTKVTPSTKVNLTGNQTLYAHWIDSTPIYTVTLDVDGTIYRQASGPNSGYYTFLAVLPAPVKDGYTFDGWYTQKTGGSLVTDSTKMNLTGDQTLYAHWKLIADEKPTMPIGHWGPWSDWSRTRYFESETRQVEPREEKEQIEISGGYTEYRYGGYATSDGKHECWCETYLRGKFGSANLRYSNWSTTRYSANGSGWTCGRCNGNHINVDHYTSDGRAWWGEYTLPGGINYYWEESRTAAPQYETRTVTFYRYRDWIVD